jgi:hypothetical protein
VSDTVSATPAPVERQIAVDILRRGLMVAPLVVLVAGLAWGGDGAASAAAAVALVVGNFLLSAAMLSWGARISPTALAGVALGGYIIRLGLITVAVLAVRSQPWVDLVPLGLTLIVTHLGLLIWEASRVSASLAFPGLRPEVESR